MPQADKPTHLPAGAAEPTRWMPQPADRALSPQFATTSAILDPPDGYSHIEAMVLSAGAKSFESRSRTYRVTKRSLDVLVALIGIILLSPIFLLVALLIRLDSPGPAFFVQERVGMGGRVFRMLKFRSMLDGSNLRLNGRHKCPDDERITRVGRWLRRTSLDELPQLFNVLCGQMSLVGPRPEIPQIVLNRYEAWQYRRFLVPQGMTGWWQVTGRGRKLLCEHTEDDLYYIERASFGFDLRILLMTVYAVCQRDGAF